MAAPPNLCKIIPHPHGFGHNRQYGIHRSVANDEAGIDHVEVFHLVGLAVDVQHRTFGVGPEPGRDKIVGFALEGQQGF